MEKAFSSVAAAFAVMIFLVEPARAADGFAKDARSGCAVFRPNLTAGEGVVWNGRCNNGYAEGPGIAQWMKGGQITVTFEGSFAAGKLQGKGRMTAAGGDRYEGEYKDGKREGQGVYISANGDRYQGGYKDNLRHGQGVVTTATGEKTGGEWNSGTLVGASTADLKSPTGAGLTQAGPSQAAGPAPGAESAPRPGTTTTTQPSSTGQPPAAGQTVSSQFVASPTCERVFAVLPIAPQLPTVGSFDYEAVKQVISAPGLQVSAAELTSFRNQIAPVVSQAVEFAKSKCRRVPRQILLYEGRVTQTLPDEGGIPVSRNNEAYVRIPNLALVAEFPGSERSRYINVSYYRGKEDAAKRAQTAAKEREAALDQAVQNLATKHRANEKLGPDPAVLFKNPFAIQGENVLMAVKLERMQTASMGVFSTDKGTIVVSEIPRGVFVDEVPIAFLVGTVLGNTKYEGSEVSAPHLKYKGAVLCRGQRTQPCHQFEEK